MLKEVCNGFQTQRIQIFRLLPLRVNGQNFVSGHCQHFAVFARFVFHFQDANGTARHHNARDKRHWGNHQHVNRVAVTTDGFRHIAIVGGVMHRRAHETVDENGASGLVDFVFHRVGVHRNFDDDVEFFGNFATGGDVI